MHDPMGLHRDSGSINEAAVFVGQEYYYACARHDLSLDKTKNHEFTLARFIQAKRSVEKIRP